MSWKQVAHIKVWPAVCTSARSSSCLQKSPEVLSTFLLY